MATTLEKPTSNRTKLLTSEEFLDWLKPGVHADLIDGETVMHSPVNLKHARLVNFIDHLLRSYIEHSDIGELHRETVAVRLSIRDTFLPDLAYFTTQQAQRLPETYVSFAPAFVLEALSPSTADNDRTRKFAAYELHGVQEYWILDPEKLDHRFYGRQGDMLAEFGADAERIESIGIRGFWVRRNWLDPDHLPKVKDCMSELLAQTNADNGKSNHSNH